MSFIRTRFSVACLENNYPSLSGSDPSTPRTLWMYFISNADNLKENSAPMIGNRFDRFVLWICFAAMVENRTFVYYFTENNWTSSWFTLFQLCFTLIPDLIVLLVLVLLLSQSHYKCNSMGVIYMFLSLTFVFGIVCTASMNISMLLVTSEFSFTVWTSHDTTFCIGRPINWRIAFQIDWKSAYTLGMPQISRFLLILLSQFTLGALIEDAMTKHIREQTGLHRIRTILHLSHHRISRTTSNLILLLTIIVCFYQPPDPWRDRSKNVLWDLILSCILHYTSTESVSHIYMDKELIDYMAQFMRAPPVDFSRAVTQLKKPIKHVFLIVLESVRADVLPLDIHFAERIGSHFYQPVTAQNVTPFLNSIWQRSVHGVASTVASYTLKSLLCTLCGVYPMSINFLAETEPNNAFYQKCLPDLVRQTFRTSENQSSFRSAFFTAARDDFDRQRQLLDRMHFDEVFNGFHIYNRSGRIPDLGLFGPPDTTILPLLWEWIDRSVAEDRTRQLFINLLTTGTHHPCDLAPDELVEDYKYYLKDDIANKYLNALRVTDKLLEEIFRGMKSRGLYDQTLFVIVSDHAQAMNDGGHIAYGTFETTLESSFLIPVMLHNPHLRAQRLRGQMTNMDILPTIMDVLLTSNSSTSRTNNVLLSDLQPSLKDSLLRYEGRSLLRWLVPNTPERYTFHLNNPGYGHLVVKQYPLKLVYAFQAKKVQLFHLGLDSDEKIDLIKLEYQPTSSYPEWLTIDSDRRASRLPERNWSVDHSISLPVLKEEGARVAKYLRNSSQVVLEQMLDWAEHSYKLAMIWTVLVKERYENSDARLWSTETSDHKI